MSEKRFKTGREFTKEYVFTPLRVLIFPVMLLVKLFRWTYGYDD